MIILLQNNWLLTLKKVFLSVYGKMLRNIPFLMNKAMRKVDKKPHTTTTTTTTKQNKQTKKKLAKKFIKVLSVTKNLLIAVDFCKFFI